MLLEKQRFLEMNGWKKEKLLEANIVSIKNVSTI